MPARLAVDSAREVQLCFWLLTCAALWAAEVRGQVAQDTAELIAQALQSASPGSSVVTVQLQTSSYVLREGTTPLVVPSNTTLLITGRGTGASTLTWVANQTTTLISLKPGAKLVISNLTIGVDAAAAPTSLPAGLNPWPVPFIASAINATAGLTQTGADIQLLDVVVQLAQCSRLASYQQLVCAYAASSPPTGEFLWAMPQVQPGAVQFRAPAPDTRFSALSNVLLTCANSATGSASAVEQPSSVQNSSTPSFSVPGWPTPACLIQPAASESQVQLLLSTVSNATLLPPSSLLVVQLMTNISLVRSAWPVDAVDVEAAVILTGMPNSMKGIVFRGLELDLDLIYRFVRLHQELGSLSIVDLCVTNMAYGPDSQFPMSMLVGALWMVRFDRPSANRTMLLLRNSQLVGPPDLFSYLSYWAAIQSSPVPSVRVTADWLRNNVYFALTVGGADTHSLLFPSREGQGTLWINSTITDTPYHAPLLMATSGITELVPGNPNAPLTQVKGVYNASQLVSALQAPTVPYLVLLYNMELNASTVQAAWNTTSTRAAVTTPVTLLGRPYRGSVILDLGGAASLLSLAMPQGSRLILQRLVVTGLGPATNNSLLGNLTSLMWAFDFSRRQPMLRLSNVTLVISPAELSVMQQALSPNLLSSASIIPANPANPALLSIIQSTWALSNAVSANQTTLILSDVAAAGMEGTQVTLSSQLPQLNYSESIFYGFNATAAADLQLIPPAAASPTEPDSTQLSTGAIVGIAVGCGLFLLCLSALGIVWWRRMQQLKQAVDFEKAAKAAALEQVEALATGTTRFTGSDGNSHFDTEQHLRTLSSLGRAAVAVGALPHAFGGSLSSQQPAPSSMSSQSSSRKLTSQTGSFPRSGTPTTASKEIMMTMASGNSMRPGQSSGGNAPHGPSPLRHGSGASGGAAGASGSSSQPKMASTASGHSAPGPLPELEEEAERQPPSEQLVRGSYDVGGSTTTLHRLMGAVVTPGRGAGREPVGPSMAALLADPEAAATLLAGVPLGNERAKTDSAGNSNNTESSKTAGSEGVPKAALVISGLAAGDEESAPDDVLTQVINQRKAMQGIDLQQVEFQEVLGQGSFGVVYKGRWRSLTVAIKTLMFQDAGAAKRLRQRAITEAAINTLLTDDNIINTYAYDLRVVGGSGMPDEKHTAHWKLYIVQEYCDAGSLAQAIDAGMLVDPHTKHNNMMILLQLALDIAKGMSYIHAANVIHGDLSSGNIMLRHERRPTCCFRAKVGDFGLSRFLEGPEHSHISNARQGTPFYIAPELMDKGIISKDTDVFSFGVLLWEMFVGRPPWRDPDLGQFRQSLNPRTFPYSVPLNCPSEYHSLIMACLAEEPKSRPRFPELVNHISTLLHMLQDALARHRGQGTAPERPAAASYVPPPPQSAQAQPSSQFYADARARGQAGIAAAVAAAAAAAAGMAPGPTAGVAAAPTARQPPASATPPVNAPVPAAATNGHATHGTPHSIARTPPQAIPQLNRGNTHNLPASEDDGPSGHNGQVMRSPPAVESWDDGVGTPSSISAPLMLQSLGASSVGLLLNQAGPERKPTLGTDPGDGLGSGGDFSKEGPGPASLGRSLLRSNTLDGETCEDDSREGANGTGEAVLQPELQRGLNMPALDGAVAWTRQSAPILGQQPKEVGSTAPFGGGTM